MATRASLDLLHALDVQAFAHACGIEQLDSWQRVVLEAEQGKVIPPDAHAVVTISRHVPPSPACPAGMLFNWRSTGDGVIL